jgi:S1-C subfamily serine protease
MGFSLMLLTPVALPAAQAAKASHATEGVQRAIGDGVRAIRAKILADGNLRDHTVASVAPRPPAEAGAATAVPRGEPYARVDSAYDGFLDSVVVIRAGRSFGTGFFVSGDGLIVTNHHVVEEGASIAVRLRSGKTLLARIVAEHRDKDLALLRVAETGQPWLKLSRGKELKLGGEVIAIGTPQGLSWSISRGIVSAVRDRSSARLIQTDAAINAGNSGGPLIDLGSGMVIGVNTLGIRKDVAEGLNFAVSSEDTLRAFPMLAKP